MIRFEDRHIGPNAEERTHMLKQLGLSSLEALIEKTIPSGIRNLQPMDLPPAASERDALAEIATKLKKNRVVRSLIGMGYSDTETPAVIQRNVLENPGWYTQYTPYQSEIAQGRLEALLNFQTMVTELTALPVANASLLDEGTAAAEAMALCWAAKDRPTDKAFFISENTFPQTIAVVETRAAALGVTIVKGDPFKVDLERGFFGVLVQNPGADGEIKDYRAFIERVKQAGAMTAIAADILSLTLMVPPGEMGADIAIGSTQRFGVPMGFGGPHAAFMAMRDELKRLMPGRVVGVSQDVDGHRAIRLALQTREQHIRRDKATSNICTAQVLLAVMASMYAVYHGPKGLTEVAKRIHDLTFWLGSGLKELGFSVTNGPVFDTVSIRLERAAREELVRKAEAAGFNFCTHYDGRLQIALDELSTVEEVEALLHLFAATVGVKQLPALANAGAIGAHYGPLARMSAFLQQPVFNKHHSETEMLRYIHRLQGKDLSLTHSMIPLGSCTMKLNATAEMIPVTFPEASKLHPFAPESQTEGYRTLFRELEGMLATATGFDAVSLQPNAGSQGEYAGLLVIRAYLESKGQGHRNVCLIPKSAHGTNPASAALAGMKVVVTACDHDGNVDLMDLQAKLNEHRDHVAALMITYPSTHGVFETQVREICNLVHGAGGQVYMDGANMNAQIGLCRPGEFGPDVCHLNLHKTFCIPHGGGGPGMGPICVRKHLEPFLPGHPLVKTGGPQAIGAISAAPWGSASILPISWMYVRMMGGDGLKAATQVAILNANYVARRLETAYPILYKGEHGFVAHECILDFRKLKDATGIEVEDVAKRLMDYGFHAPTVSFPVAGTLMVEPTESESLAELDRFCEALLAIREEIREIETGKADRARNLLKLAPHTAEQIASDAWDRPYTRARAVYPLPWVKAGKFWPSVGRINNVLGDRNLICSCPATEDWSA